MTGSTYPLQRELIDAVIAFANLDIRDTAEIREVFGVAWPADQLPSLRTCRDIQRDTREWLTAPMLAQFDPIFREIRFEGRISKAEGYTVLEKVRGKKEPVRRAQMDLKWTWWISKATLRGICALAVATIDQAVIERKDGSRINLRDRIGICQRNGCGLLFIDRESRGTPRKYCKTEECEREIGNAHRRRSYKEKGK